MPSSVYQIKSPTSQYTYEFEFENEPSREDLDAAIRQVDLAERNSGQGVIGSSLAAIPRGALKSLSSGVKGIGDVFGIEGLSKAGQHGKEGADELFNINPANEDKFLVKAGGVVGQVGEQIGETFLGMSVLRGLGLAGKAATTAAFLTPAFFKGADQGAELAKQYGIDGVSRKVAILGGGLIEAGTEAFGSKFLPGGGTALETAVVSRFLNRGATKALGQSGFKFLASGVAGEGLEEVESDILQNLLAKGLTDEDPNRPGYTPNGQKIPGVFSGNLMEDFTFGAVGGLAFAGPAALANLSSPRRMIEVDGRAVPIPEGVDDEKLKAFGLDPASVRKPTKEENDQWDAIEVGRSLSDILARRAELDSKDTLTPDEKLEQEDLVRMSEALDRWLGKKALTKMTEDSAKKVKEAVASGADPVEAAATAASGLAAAEDLVRTGGRATFAPDPTLAAELPAEDLSGEISSVGESNPTLATTASSEAAPAGETISTKPEEVMPNEEERQRKAEVLDTPQTEAPPVSGQTEGGANVPPAVPSEGSGTGLSAPDISESIPVTENRATRFMQRFSEGRDLSKWSPEELATAQMAAAGDRTALSKLPDIKRRIVQNALPTSQDFETHIAKGPGPRQTAGSFAAQPGDILTINNQDFKVRENKKGLLTIENAAFGRQEIDPSDLLPVQKHIKAQASEILRGKEKLTGAELQKASNKLTGVVNLGAVEVAQTAEDMARFYAAERDGRAPGEVQLATEDGPNPKGMFVEKSNRPDLKGKSVLYLNMANATADTPVHEIAGHQFLSWLRDNHREVWNSGVKLLLENEEYVDAVKVLYFDEIEKVRQKFGEQAALDYLHEEALSTVLGQKGQEVWQTTADSQRLWQRIKAWIERVLTMFKRWGANHGLFGPAHMEQWRKDFGVRGMTLAEWARNANLALRTGAFKNESIATGGSEPKFSKDPSEQTLGRTELMPEGPEKKLIQTTQAAPRWTQPNDPAIKQAERFYKQNNAGKGWDQHISGLVSIWENLQRTPAGLSPTAVARNPDFVYDSTPGIYYGMLLNGLRTAYADPKSSSAQKRAVKAAFDKLGKAVAPFNARAGRALQGLAAGYRQYAFPELEVATMADIFAHGSSKNLEAFNDEISGMMAKLQAVLSEIYTENLDNPEARDAALKGLERAFAASVKADDVADHVEAELAAATDQGGFDSLITYALTNYTGQLKELTAQWVELMIEDQLLREMESSFTAKMSKGVDASAMKQAVRERLLARLGANPTKEDVVKAREENKAKQIKVLAALNAAGKPAKVPKARKTKEKTDVVPATKARKPKEGVAPAAGEAATTPEAPMVDPAKRLAYGSDALLKMLSRVLRKKTGPVTDEDASPGRVALDVLVNAIGKKMAAKLPKMPNKEADRAMRLALLTINPGEAWGIREEMVPKLKAWAEENKGMFDQTALDVLLQQMIGQTFNASGEGQAFTPQDARNVLRDEFAALGQDLRTTVTNAVLANETLEKAIARVRERVTTMYGNGVIADRVEAVLRAEWNRSARERAERASRSRERLSQREQLAADIREARAAEREKTKRRIWAFRPLREAEALKPGEAASQKLVNVLGKKYGIKLNELFSEIDDSIRNGNIEQMLGQLAEWLGYTREQTERFVRPMTKALAANLDAKRQAKLKKALEPDKSKKRVKQSYFEKQIELIKLGALNQENYANVLLGSRGMKGMTEEFKAKLVSLIQERNRAPEKSVRENQLNHQINQLVSAARGVGIGSYLMETTMAHIFSGINTHKVNTIFGFLGVQSDIAVQARAAAKLIPGLNAKERLAVQWALEKESFKGFTDQYARAAAPLIFKTGESFVEDPFTQFSGNLLEVKKAHPEAPMTFWGNDLPQWMNFLDKTLTKATTYHPYVRRSLVAEDIANRAPMWEAVTARQALPEAINLLKSQGKPLTGPNISKAIDEVNYGEGGREAAVGAALAQVDQEVADGLLEDVKIRRNERVRQLLREKLNPLDGMSQAERIEEIEQEGRYSTLAHDVPGFMGGLSRMMVQFAEFTRVGRLFVPAIRVPMAAIHKSMDWTPWGFLRWRLAKSTGRASVTGNLLNRVPALQETNKHFMKVEEGRQLTAVPIEALRLKALYGTGITTLITALIWSAIDDDDHKALFYITAQGPRDPEEKRQWRQRGFQPYSIRVGWMDFSYRESPIFAALLPIGALSDAKRYDNGKHWEDMPSRFAATTTMTARAMTDQVALESMAQLLGVMSAGSSGYGGQEEQVLKKALGRVAGSAAFPNFGRELNDILYGPQDSKARSWAAAMFQNVPFVPSLENRPAINALGDVIHEQRGGVGGEIVNSLAYRLATKPVNDPKLHFLAKMDLGKLFTGRRKMDGTLVMDDYPLYREWAIRSGKALREALTDEVISDFEKELKSDKGQALKDFDKFVSAIRKEALDDLLNEKDQ